MSFMERSARHFLMIKAAREFKQELEKAGMDNLKTLAEAGISIVGTYLDGTSPQEKGRVSQDLNALLQMGVTPNMILTDVARQMPELKLIMEQRQGYTMAEVRKLEQFMKGG
ncbi:hypothetical protein LCGC14_0791640 [marine sediment metagenome]|uniref:Uncharacterized protein n=1 Tax=marine sediment metagenome TaxID=412755 RepID=A0A0F9SZH4_9ZZZZ